MPADVVLRVCVDIDQHRVVAGELVCGTPFAERQGELLDPERHIVLPVILFAKDSDLARIRRPSIEGWILSNLSKIIQVLTVKIGVYLLPKFMPFFLYD